MGAWDLDDVMDKDSNLFGLNVLGEKWVGTIDKFRWETDPKVGEGETLIAKLTVDTGHPNPEFTTLEISYNNGKKFESNDGGLTATPIKSDVKVHPNSGFGILLAETFKIKEAVQEMSSRANSPLEAAAWEGLTFTWGVSTKDYKGDIGKLDRWVPIAFGADESVVNASKGGSSEPRDRDELEEELKTLAKDSKDADDFLGKAMKVDGFTDHDDLVSGYKKFYTAANK